MLTLEDKLENYRIIKNKLAEVKEDEMELRLAIAEELSVDNLSAGTHNFDFTGLHVKLVTKLYKKIDKSILETLELSEEEAECIRWKPEIDARAYKNADDTDTLDEAVIVTNATPTLTVELVE